MAITSSGIARRRKDARDGTTWDPFQPLLDGRRAERPDSVSVAGLPAQR